MGEKCPFCNKSKTRKLSPWGMKIHIRNVHKQELRIMEMARERSFIRRVKAILAIKCPPNRLKGSF